MCVRYFHYLHTGGHNRSSGISTFRWKSCCKRVVVSCLRDANQICSRDVRCWSPLTYRTAAGSLKSSWPFGFKLFSISIRLFVRGKTVSRTAWRSRAIVAPRLQNRRHFCRDFGQIPWSGPGYFVKTLSVLEIIDKIRMWMDIEKSKSTVQKGSWCWDVPTEDESGQGELWLSWWAENQMEQTWPTPMHVASSLHNWFRKRITISSKLVLLKKSAMRDLWNEEIGGLLKISKYQSRRRREKR